MVPGIFKKITQKLKCLDKFKMPLELIDIIKSFAFYEVFSFPYYKIITKKKQMLTDNFFRVEYIPGIIANGRWTIVIMYCQNPYLFMQSQNCINCGEYLLTSWETHPNAISSLPICKCH